MITGTVTDATSAETLPGANVIITDPGSGALIAGTTTDGAGRFSIQGEALKMLTVSYIGYKSASHYLATPNSNFKIQLTPSAAQLKEVEIIGEGPSVKRPWLLWLILAAGAAYMIYYFKTH